MVWVLIFFLRSPQYGGNRYPVTLEFMTSRECHKAYEILSKNFGHDVEAKYLCFGKTKIK